MQISLTHSLTHSLSFYDKFCTMMSSIFFGVWLEQYFWPASRHAPIISVIYSGDELLAREGKCLILLPLWYKLPDVACRVDRWPLGNDLPITFFISKPCISCTWAWDTDATLALCETKGSRQDFPLFQIGKQGLVKVSTPVPFWLPSQYRFDPTMPR